MTVHFTKTIDSVINSIRESYCLGPTLLNTLKLLEQIKTAPDTLQGEDISVIENHFEKVVDWS